MDWNDRQSHDKEELFDALPIARETSDLFSQIEQAVHDSPRKVVVLDDDPTGTQTVHGIDVLTGWEIDDLRRAFLTEAKLFFILTNSRSLETEQARVVTEQIALNLCQVARETGVDFDVISRSDSTLRGHYPDEIDVLEQVISEQLGIRFDGHLLIPAFFEGGRFTVNDIHYVLENGQLIPAAETEFAKDAVFGYRNSHMPHYIEEKTAGACAASAVICISISDLREGGPSRVTEILAQQHHAARIVVNAVNYQDMEIFVLGLLAAEQAGRRFLVRSSASYVKIRGAVKPIPYLGRDDIVDAKSQHFGGLVVVGSYVGKTSAQIEAARAIKDLRMLEVKVENLLDKAARTNEIATVRQEVEQAIQTGQDVLIYTSRNLVRRDDEDENLSVGKKVSSALVEIVGKLTTQPRFLIAKGGITSSDLATDALGVKSARVLGQVGPGISVWELQAEAKFPGMAYVVFPGNVGAAETLAEIIALLRGPASA